MRDKLVLRKEDNMVVYSDENNILIMSRNSVLYFSRDGIYVRISGVWFIPNYFTEALSYYITDNNGEVLRRRLEKIFENTSDFFENKYTVIVGELIDKLPFTEEPTVIINGKEADVDTVEFYRDKEAIFFRVKNSEFVRDNVINDVKKRKRIPLVAFIPLEFVYSPTVEGSEYCKLYISYPFIAYSPCANCNCSRFIVRNIPITRYLFGLEGSYNVYYRRSYGNILIRSIRDSRMLVVDDTTKASNYTGIIRSMFVLKEAELSGGTV